MYINKNDKGYGYYSTVKSKDKNGEEVTAFVSVNFKKGSEPSEKSIKGELYFIDEYGDKRKAFFTSYKRADGTTSPGLFLMDIEHGRNYNYKEIEQQKSKQIMDEIKPEELPFY